MPQQKYLLIPAGGSGNRFGGDIPKQFLPLAGKPILVRTIQAFISAVGDIKIVLVLPKEHLATWDKIKNEYFHAINIQTSEGGATRFDSVKNGLTLLPDSGIVAIHDAVRPFVSKALIEKCFIETEANGNAVAAIEPKDSLFEINNKQVYTRNRVYYRLAQTPQCFLLPEIKKAFQQPYNPSFTDDASVFESAGGKILLVEGEQTNIKITTREDLLFAEAISNQRLTQ